MTFTDPPYNVAYEGKTAKKLTIDNDALGGKFYEFLRDASANMLAMTKGAIYMCMRAAPVPLPRHVRQRGPHHDRAVTAL
jgi:hypothetical protein